MNIVITMAGLGMRFRDVGYTVPKYQIEACGKTLFEWSMMGLEDYHSPENRYIFIVRKEDEAGEFIRTQCGKIGIQNCAILELDEPTDGQATTALMAEAYWSESEPIIICVIDTYIEPGALRLSDIKGDGYIPCFHADGNHWSFVRLGTNGSAVEVKEKERISDNCTLGIYYFSNCALFKRLYNDFYVQGSPCLKERYVAPLYNELIRQNGLVHISIVESDKVHVLGTPEELKNFEDNYTPGYPVNVHGLDERYVMKDGHAYCVESD